MAKTPMAIASPLAPLRPQLHGLAKAFDGLGFSEFNISKKGGILKAKASDSMGTTVTLVDTRSPGFRQVSISRSDPKLPSERKRAAKILRKQGLTQVEIADRLGCSQKTISNDLKK